MWILIVPLVTIAFLLLYAHKYSYKLLENNKLLHIGIYIIPVGLFLFIPLIFLTNINLMLMPEKWQMVKGFFSALALPNVWPRYFHFIFASLAVTGLFLMYYFGRKSFEFESNLPQLNRKRIQKSFYSLAFFASAAQFLMGPIVLITLPQKGISWNMIGVILLGASIAIPVLILLWKEITGPLEKIGKHFRLIASLLTCVVIFMGYGRHLYRATSLEPHQKLVKAKTEAYLLEVENAKKAKLLNKDEVAEAALMPGEAVFNANCKACHDVKEVIVGPSMLEAANIYKGNEPGLIAWIKAPGKKRDGPKMPPQAHLSATELKDVAAWILTLNAKPEAK